MRAKPPQDSETRAFLLPEGNVQIAFSGGRTSGMMLHNILEANGGLPDRAKVIFTNTGREMPETLDFVQECGERWGVHIVWLEYRPPRSGAWPFSHFETYGTDELFAKMEMLPFPRWYLDNMTDQRFAVVSHNSASRDGEPFEALIRKRKMLPNRVARFCTAELKVHCASRYLKDQGWDTWYSAIGIRADESRRISTQPPRERWQPWRPMHDAGLTKADVSAFWARQPFDLRLQNVNGKTPFGNCDGCFLKSEANLAALAREHPERAAWWARMETLIPSTKHDGHNLFNQRRSVASTIDMVSQQGDWIFDTEGALCQADDGECVG